VYLAFMTSIGFVVQRGRFVGLFAKRLAWGGGLTLVLLMVFGTVASAGFDSVFLKFHQLSFANDFWQLDPRTDYLVRIFPQDFWFDATLWVVVRAIAGALLLTVAGGAFLVYPRYTSLQRAPSGLESERDLN